jgi:hypothetical protein
MQQANHSGLLHFLLTPAQMSTGIVLMSTRIGFFVPFFVSCLPHAFSAALLETRHGQHKRDISRGISQKSTDRRLQKSASDNRNVAVR